ncbi:MAG: hypothetical protein GY765_37245 [bacterium]|nr:hypothetical protein [bacterium]
MPAEAAQCLLNIKDYLHAAWLFAEHAGLFNRARSVLREVNPENVVEELTYDVIMARCEKGNGLASTAVELLNAVITRFGELDKGPDRRRIEEWTMAVIKHLGRPDLSAAMFAAAYAAGFHEVEQRWEDWALQNLGDAAGVPSTDDSPDRDGRK